MDSVKLIFDHAQPRLARPMLGILATGGVDGDRLSAKPISGWSDTYVSQTAGEDDTWVDPIMGMLMLTPLPLLTLWDTTDSGNFARLGLGDFTYSSSSNWVIHNVNGYASQYIHGLDPTVSSSFVTTASHPANQGIYFSAFVEDAANGERGYISVGWGGYQADVWFKFFASGAVEIYDGAELQGTEQLSALGSKTTNGSWGTWPKVVMIPMRSGILCYSSHGGGFFWEKPGVDAGQNDAPTITAAGSLWFEGSGSTTIEFAPLKYRSSGYRCTHPTEWPFEPQLGDEVYHRLYGPTTAQIGSAITAAFTKADDPTATLDGGTGWTGVGVKSAMVKLTFATDGTTSPFVAAVHSTVAGLIVDTNASEERDVTAHCSSLSFDVPESKDVSWEFTLVETETLQSEENGGEIANLRTLTNRPVLVRIGEIDVFDGMLAERPRQDIGPYRDADVLHFRCEGMIRLLKRFRFLDYYPFDGMKVHTALAKIANLAGIPEDRLAIEEFDLTAGAYSTPSRGGFQHLAKPGDTAYEWWETFMDEYLPDCHWCERPTDEGVVKLTVWSPENQPQTGYRIFDRSSSAREYLEGEDITGHELNNMVPARVYRSLHSTGIEPEANMIWVQGIDYKTRRPLVAYVNVDALQDPTLAPSERDPDWSGDILIYGVHNGGLSTQAEVEEAARRRERRMAYSRKLREVEIDLMSSLETGVPVWAGEGIEMVDTSDDASLVTDWTVVRFGGSFVREFEGSEREGQMIARPCRYVLEEIKGDTSKGLGHRLPGRSLRDMLVVVDGLRAYNSFAGRPDNAAPRITTVSL